MRYLVRQRVFSFAASFWITDEDGSDRLREQERRRAMASG